MNTTISYWVLDYWGCGNCGRINSVNHASCEKCGLGERPPKLDDVDEDANESGTK